MHEQFMRFARTQFSGIAQVLLIFHCSIAIPIPGLWYCIAIQNSKTCSSLQSMKTPMPPNIQEAVGKGWIKLTEIILKGPDKLEMKNNLEFDIVKIKDMNVKRLILIILGV